MIPYFRTKSYTLIPLIVMALLSFLITFIYLKTFNITLSPSLIIIQIPLLMLFAISGSSWYICEYLEFRKATIFSTLSTHLLSGLISLSVWVILSRFYITFISKALGNPDIKQIVKESKFYFLAIGIGIYFGSILTHYLIITIKKRKEAELLAFENNLLKTKAELKFLKSAIHPHFLFNSLNLLTPIINQNPTLAKETISHLSEFLLYSLRFSKKDEVSILDEINHIKDYLSIESLRLQERLKVEYQISDDVLDYNIPPLTMLPMVENAIKHGIEQLIEGGKIIINIQNSSDNNYLIEVKNPYKSYHSPKGSNLGLYILKKRLREYFGSDVRIKIDTQNDWFSIQIHLPLEKINEKD